MMPLIRLSLFLIIQSTLALANSGGNYPTTQIEGPMSYQVTEAELRASLMQQGLGETEASAVVKAVRFAAGASKTQRRDGVLPIEGYLFTRGYNASFVVDNDDWYYDAVINQEGKLVKLEDHVLGSLYQGGIAFQLGSYDWQFIFLPEGSALADIYGSTCGRGFMYEFVSPYGIAAIGVGTAKCKTGGLSGKRITPVKLSLGLLDAGYGTYRELSEQKAREGLMAMDPDLFSRFNSITSNPIYWIIEHSQIRFPKLIFGQPQIDGNNAQ